MNEWSITLYIVFCRYDKRCYYDTVEYPLLHCR